AGWVLVSASDDPAAARDRFGGVLAPLRAVFVGRGLLGPRSYLLPMALGGGPAVVRRHTAVMERHWPQRVTTANLALLGFLLPVPPYVRISTSLLVLVVLVQFLVPAARLLLTTRR